MFLERSLLLSGFGFYTPYPERRINSLYFDSFNLSSIHESVEGFSRRIKKRVRWYGKLKSECSSNLEFKIKKAHLTSKRVKENYCRINPSATAWSCFFSDQKWQELCQTRYSFPRSIVCYKRTYYQSTNKKIRITFDEDIKIYDQYLHRAPNLNLSKLLHDKLVVEIKVSCKDHLLAKEMQKVIPFSPRRFSKYCESHFQRKPIPC